MRGTLVIFLLSIGLGLGAGATTAQAATGDDCVIYYKPQPVMGPQLIAMFSWFRDAAVRECVTTRGKKEYYILTKPKAARFGVCQYSEFPMTKAKVVDRVLLMSRPQTDCPQQGEAYVVTRDVSPGVFLALVQFWDRVVTRPATLKTTGNVVRAAPSFQSLEAAIKRKEKLRLDLIRLQTKPDGTLPYYSLTIRGANAAWVLLLDVGLTGVEAIGSGTAQ
jgi:hypothetical protein